MERSRMAVILLLVVIFTALLTYRMLLHQSSEHDLYLIDHRHHNRIIFNNTGLQSSHHTPRASENNLRADSMIPLLSVETGVIIDSIVHLGQNHEQKYKSNQEDDERKRNDEEDDIVAAYKHSELAEAQQNADPALRVGKHLDPVEKTRVRLCPKGLHADGRGGCLFDADPLDVTTSGTLASTADNGDVVAATAKPQGNAIVDVANRLDFKSVPALSVPVNIRARVCPEGLHKDDKGGCQFDTMPKHQNFTLPDSVRELRPIKFNKFRVKDTRRHPHLSDRERERRQNLLYGDHHNWKSPQPGSHIREIDHIVDHEELAAHHPDEVHDQTDFTHAYSYMHCVNQSRCIEPELQLQPKLKIYYCKHPVTYGVRFYYLVREGLVLHPNVELVSDIDSSDYIVYLPGSAPWHKTECNHTRFASRLIVLDEFDFSYHFFPARNNSELRERYEPFAQKKTPGYIHNVVGNDQWWFYTYFKRSFVKKYNGTFVNYPHLFQSHIYPITYSVAEAYLPARFQFERTTEILCTLRGSHKMPTRQRVQDAVAAYVRDRNITNAVTAQVSTASRTTVSSSYFDQMRNAEIIVTVNPAYWEGDFRLWESMATGALIFCDYLDVPHPHPLVHGEHIIFFDNHNMTELALLLDYYRANKQEARRIAYNGYLFAMKYHRTVNMIDYVLRTTVTKAKWEHDHSSWNRLKEVMPKSQVDPTVFMAGSNKPIPPEINYYGYTYTGQFLNYRAAQQLAGMKLDSHKHFNGTQV